MKLDIDNNSRHLLKLVTDPGVWSNGNKKSNKERQLRDSDQKET